MDGERISVLARERPEKAAIIMGRSGQVTTFAGLEAHSNQAAHLFRGLGLKAGDAIAFCMENRAELIEIAWGALRSGLVLVPISSRLTANEIAYIVGDSGAKLLVASSGLDAETFANIPFAEMKVALFCLGKSTSAYRSWTEESARQPTMPILDESYGTEMLYSSGTTGRPKGVRWIEEPGSAQAGSNLGILERLGVDENAIYLSPAPLYHSAPFRWAIGVIRAGGTTVVMEKFEPEHALSLIEKYRISVSQWVPTHFVRMLKLPEAVRKKYDLSSLKLAVHAAAPCPIPIKREMIEWWGSIIFEYFGSTEQTAMTFITAQEWLAHPGSVGRSVLGTIHICDDNGEPVPIGAVGTIYSESGKKFYYHNEPKKTDESRNSRGWTTVGDVGYMDADGYIYLTDRKHFMIITGGVNVYPQEIENLLMTHPKVTDAAVIGLPDPEMGETVTAVIQPGDMADATPAFAEELRHWMRQSLSGVKVPRRFEFLAELPRLPTGKLQKFALRERYTKNI